MSANLSVEINGLKFKNPVLTASGCFSYGEEASEIYDLSLLGGVVTKSLTYLPREGHPPPKVHETASGMLNAIGLTNVGLERFLSEKLPFLAGNDTNCIVSIAGSRLEEYARLAERLSDEEDVDALEVNISCPNVDEGGLEFGAYPEPAGKVIAAVKDKFPRPLIAKLSPNVTDIVNIARSVTDSGADSISLINTLVGTAIDVKTRSFKLSNGFGGLSGPAIKPVALAMVYKVASAIKVPVIGIGGISSASDAIEFLLAGAIAVQVGTACFFDPLAPVKIIDGIREYLEDNNFDDVNDIIGTVRQ
ncbi:MAG: dihydroorotate dehydrogenase [Candidatus Zixiibacteriota bacterium]|nr:MAG: dihydroorotate dehydrogenase [candidate division Zixibacteria bacterium]